MLKLRPKNEQELTEILRDAWLGIHIDEDKIYNPLMNIPEYSEDKPELYFTFLMSQPEYFSFVCNELFNIEIMPFQGVILNELWQRRFPMLIASRGASKSFTMALYALLRMLFLKGRKIIVAGSGFRQSKIIYNYMETIYMNSPLLRDIMNSSIGGGRSPIQKSPDEWMMRIGESITKCIPIGDGCLTESTLVTYNDSIGYINRNSPEEEGITKTNISVWNGKNFTLTDESYNNGLKPTIKITTKKGYSIEGTHNHKLIFNENGEIWKRLDKVSVGDEVFLNASNSWHNNDDINYSELDSYVLGLMIGDGSWVNQYHIQYTTQDKELIDSVSSVFNKDFKKLDDCHYKLYSKEKRQEWLDKWQMEKSYTLNKKLPQKLLSLSKQKVARCISGLFDTDGTIQINKSKGGIGCTISFTNTSEELVNQLHVMLLKFGIISTLKYRDRNEKWNRVYEIYINGRNIKKFYEQIGFGLKRKQDQLEYAINNKERWPSQEKWNDDNFIDTIVKIEHGEAWTYDIHVPETHLYIANGFISHNSKARGQRAHDVLVDEFASIPIEIFETVLAQFAAVSSSPGTNVKREAAIAKAKEYGYDGIPFDDFEIIKDSSAANQIVISGTAYYDFNHFAQYHKRWCGIIKSQGDMNKLTQVLNDRPEDNFDWKDYSVIRIPYNLLPKGFMDDAQIMRSKATMTVDNFQRELGCVFSKDSNGFFKRSLLENCTVLPEMDLMLPNGTLVDSSNVFFEPRMYGDPKKEHVIAVDPASMVDNFAVIILELNEGFRKIVHCWTTNKKDHQDRIRMGLTNEHNFYAYACRKIRQLMKQFNTIRLSIDSEGGGREIMAQFTDRDKLEPDELPIYHIIDPLKPNPLEDGETGLHIIDEIHFASAEWTTNANHGLKKDFEDKVLLFPYVDAISFALADSDDEEKKREHDSLNQCIREIEELKNELSTIIVTETPSGRERWDTPEQKLATGKKGRMRKDRYSALLMANMTARLIPSTTFNPLQFTAGGFSNDIPKKQEEKGSMYTGPSWLAQQFQDLYS